MEVNNYEILANGDNGISVVFGQSISLEANEWVYALMDEVKKDMKTGILSLVPSYCELLIIYDPLKLSYKALEEWLKPLLSGLSNKKGKSNELVYIPVYYGGATGPDLETVAKVNNLSIEEVIGYHTAAHYRVYMIGFKPGFPYLGGMSEKIATPRLEKPRLKVPAGSVGIAGQQTGIYPQSSPGGWQLIGHTPLPLVDWTSESISLIKPGQYIKFESVDLAEYEAIKEAIANGVYKVRVEKGDGVKE